MPNLSGPVSDLREKPLLSRHSGSAVLAVLCILGPTLLNTAFVLLGITWSNRLWRHCLQVLYGYTISGRISVQTLTGNYRLPRREQGLQLCHYRSVTSAGAGGLVDQQALYGRLCPDSTLGETVCPESHSVVAKPACSLAKGRTQRRTMRQLQGQPHPATAMALRQLWLSWISQGS